MLEGLDKEERAGEGKKRVVGTYKRTPRRPRGEAWSEVSFGKGKRGLEEAKASRKEEKRIRMEEASGSGNEPGSILSLEAGLADQSRQPK